MNVQVNQNERLIRPSDPSIRYTGRIDNSNPDAPFLIYVCSQVEFRVTGHVLRVFIENIHSFYENRLGVIINGVESAVLLESGAQVIDLSDRMTDGETMCCSSSGRTAATRWCCTGSPSRKMRSCCPCRRVRSAAWRSTGTACPPGRCPKRNLPAGR